MSAQQVARHHELIPAGEPERPNRWWAAATCQCICGCGFLAIPKAPDWPPTLCSHCAADEPDWGYQS